MDECCWMDLKIRDRLVRDFLSEYCEFTLFCLCLVSVFLIILVIFLCLVMALLVRYGQTRDNLGNDTWSVLHLRRDVPC